MTDNIEQTTYDEFTMVFAEESKMLTDVKNSTLKSLLMVFSSETAISSAVQGAAETEDMIIRGTYSRVMSAFMQPAPDDEDAEGDEGAEAEPDTGESGPRAGRGG